MPAAKRTVYNEQFYSKFCNFLLQEAQGSIPEIKFKDVAEFVDYYNQKTTGQQQTKESDFQILKWIQIDTALKKDNLIPQHLKGFSFKFFHNQVLSRNLQKWSKKELIDVIQQVIQQISINKGQLLKCQDRDEYNKVRHQIQEQVILLNKNKLLTHPLLQIQNKIRNQIDIIYEAMKNRKHSHSRVHRLLDQDNQGFLDHNSENDVSVGDCLNLQNNLYDQIQNLISNKIDTKLNDDKQEIVIPQNSVDISVNSGELMQCIDLHSKKQSQQQQQQQPLQSQQSQQSADLYSFTQQSLTSMSQPELISTILHLQQQLQQLTNSKAESFEKQVQTDGPGRRKQKQKGE